MTGLDFSQPAVDVARTLARDLGQDTDFVHSDVYDAPDVLERNGFDFVFTGIGDIVLATRRRPLGAGGNGFAGRWWTPVPSRRTPRVVVTGL